MFRTLINHVLVDILDEGSFAPDPRGHLTMSGNITDCPNGVPGAAGIHGRKQG